ncbi:PREDICTED: olfactory receptor 2AP1-like [Nanorana parkeri]|uniref:olfactory receptor 2AP1-like n=1 Tax=Nanorana parkeri TaxID=125878 RepID=UPI000854AEDB|nr:PREDICTED: olfactory receptor 2AP1-like [Nanorana parkeri]
MHENKTLVAYFILKGISDVSKLQVPIFLLVLFIYLITLGSNLTILLLVCLDSKLHTPMYFFLANLSILDISSVTVTLHKVLITFETGYNIVSFTDCMEQVYIFSWLSGNELILLTAMSYDRYAAICNPLQYSTVMRRSVCVGLAIFCWSFSFLQILPAMILLSQFSCYTSNIINHFFCDIMPLLSLSCSDTSTLELLIFTQGLLLCTFIPFLLTFISYVFIIATIMRIKSSTGRSKAFYTCSSHVTVVTLHYAILVCQYFTPSGTLKFGKLLSLFNTAVVPMLNPLIYSLKNKDVKSALQRQLKYFTALRLSGAFSMRGFLDSFRENLFFSLLKWNFQ